MPYLFRAALFLIAYATLLGAPLYFMLRVFFESIHVPLAVTGVMVSVAVIDKARRHKLLERATWRGKGILGGEILLLAAIAVIGLLQYSLPDVTGFLIMFTALAFPAGFVLFVGWMALWVAGVMLVPRQLQRSMEGPHAT